MFRLVQIRAFAYAKINMTQKLGRVEKNGYQHFRLFQQCFQKLLFQGHQKLRLCGKELTHYQMTTF